MFADNHETFGKFVLLLQLFFSYRFNFRVFRPSIINLCQITKKCMVLVLSDLLLYCERTCLNAIVYELSKA